MIRVTNSILFVLFAITIKSRCIGQENKSPVPVIQLDKQYELIGQLGVKLGEIVTVSGIVIEGASQGYADGPHLLIQVINGNATQRNIQIPISPYLHSTSSTNKLKNGSTYKMEVYETGEYVGIPWEVVNRSKMPIQNGGFYFQNRLIFLSAKRIDLIQWSPQMFIDQYALLSGVAKNENEIAFIENSNWKLELKSFPKWPNDAIGKQAEVYGKIASTSIKGNYSVDDCQPRLINLKDQLGKTVTLRGTAWSLNDEWWFNYRGIDMYVENMDQLPNWKVDNHGAAIEITGLLDHEKLPAIDQIAVKSKRDLKNYYIVRNASWKPIDGLLTPEISLDE